MKNTYPFYIVFQIWRVLLIKICKIKPFLVAFTSFDISRYHFVELHLTLSDGKTFVTDFPFLTDSVKPPTLTPLNAKIC